jgi:hypothetical protein
MKRGGIRTVFLAWNAYNSVSMFRRAQLVVSLAFVAILSIGWSFSRANNQVKDLERQIFARTRVFPEVGPGVSELKRDAAGRYYILAGPANTIFVYSADGKRTGQIPASSQSDARIVFAQDFDLDEWGHVIVADRGANAVKIFAPDGSLSVAIPVATPTSVVALSGGEFAVTSLSSKRLVNVFDANGLLVRSFGDPIGAAGRANVNPLTNRGRISGDPAGHIYFAFTNLPDPTIREYDRFGYGAYVLALTAAEFSTSTQDQRKDIFGIERRNDAASAKPVIGAVGVDLATQQVWVAIGSSLVHFDKDGTRLLTYHTVTKDGLRVEASAILIEPDRLLLADDPIGIFDFARPDKP